MPSIVRSALVSHPAANMYALVRDVESYPHESIQMSLLNGPFRALSGKWLFKSIDDNACKVELTMEFEFQSRLVGMVMGPAFSKICDTMVAAFVKRAGELDSSPT